MKKIFLLVFASFLLASCLPTVSKKTEPEDNGEFVLGQIVKGFPNLPLYPKARIIESYGLDRKYGASFVVEEDLGKVVNFYGSSLKQFGWEFKLRENSQINYRYDIKNAIHAGSIIINTASDGRSTAITVAVEPR